MGRFFCDNLFVLSRFRNPSTLSDVIYFSTLDTQCGAVWIIFLITTRWYSYDICAAPVIIITHQLQTTGIIEIIFQLFHFFHASRIYLISLFIECILSCKRYSTIKNVCSSVRLYVSQQNPSKAWNHHPLSFILHPSPFTLHHSLIILHFATFKLFSLLQLKWLCYSLSVPHTYLLFKWYTRLIHECFGWTTGRWQNSSQWFSSGGGSGI